MTPRTSSRRRFLAHSALGGSLLILPPALRGRAAPSPNERLRLALVGVGGRGRIAMGGLKDEQFVAFCDVDDQRGRLDGLADPAIAPLLAKFTDARWFKDYRVMFDEMSDGIDAVVVATPDHMHFPIAMAAVARRKHLLVEKPMCRCIAEVRALQAAAKAAGVVTQMGNQGRAAEGIRLAREWVQAGLLGEVHTVDTWTDRPRAPWFLPADFDPDAGAADAVPPPTLDWDLWLGASPARPYRPEFVPMRWRGFTAFGTGSLGDMGCHQLDAPCYALDLGAPTSVEAATTARYPGTFPASSAVTWRFPARAGRGPVELRWFDGALRPPVPVPGFRLAEGGGSLFHGTEGTMWVASHSASARLLPEARMKALAGALPPKSIPRIAGGHYQEWCRAIRGGPACGSHFDYAAPLTELVLLGVVAQRTQARLEWDAAGMRFPHFPEADRLLGPGHAYRPGWGVG
jgi:predicted dehydrogenase